jgi:hypothetical protein
MAQKTRADAKWSTPQNLCNNLFKWILRNQLNPYSGQQWAVRLKKDVDSHNPIVRGQPQQTLAP